MGHVPSVLTIVTTALVGSPWQVLPFLLAEVPQDLPQEGHGNARGGDITGTRKFSGRGCPAKYVNA